MSYSLKTVRTTPELAAAHGVRAPFAGPLMPGKRRRHLAITCFGARTEIMVIAKAPGCACDGCRR